MSELDFYRMITEANAEVMGCRSIIKINEFAKITIIRQEKYLYMWVMFGPITIDYIEVELYE
jgi:hypothetical protein